MKHTYFNVGMTAANFPIVHRAVDKANQLMLNQVFYGLIINKAGGTFYLANCTTEIVAQELAFFRKTLTVEIWYPKWRYSSAIAMFDPKTPHKIYLNGYKMNRTDGEVVASCVHELVHACDYDSVYSFGHANNTWTRAKEDSAPYWCDMVAEAIVDKKPITEVKPGKNKKIITRGKVWYKPWTWND